MIRTYTYIDDNLKSRLFDLVGTCNCFDSCNQPYMLDNDTDFFENVPKFFVAKTQSAIAAFASIFFIDEKTVYLYGFTHPQFRRQGLMKQLLNTIDLTLSLLNVDAIVIPISHDNNIGLSFVQHLEGTSLETECLMCYSLDDFTAPTDIYDLCLEEIPDADFCKFVLKKVQGNNTCLEEIGQVFCMYDAEAACIFDVEIFTDYRHKGYGSTLITLLFKKLKARGVKSISLHVTKENTAAYKLYLKHGFTKKEIITYFLTNIHMLDC